jgi:phosphate-selective porin
MHATDNTPTRRLRRTVALLALAGVVSGPVAADELPAAAPTPLTEAVPTASADSTAEEHGAQHDTAPATEPDREPHGIDLHLYWKRGLNYTLQPRLLLGPARNVFGQEPLLSGRIGLKLGVDTAGYFEHGSLPPLGTEFNLRRIFFYTSGEFHFLVPILFKIDFGGVDDHFYFSDGYVWMRDLPYVGTVKFGQFDAPMSLEAVTGSTDETFMEYGSPVEAFAPGLKVGLEIADHTQSKRVTWAYGYFTNGQKVDVGDASVSVARLAGRVTWLALKPTSADDTLVHVGASASYVISSHDRIRYKARPESFLAPALVDTGNLDTNDALPFGLEFAAKRGPLTIQAEYLASELDAGAFGHLFLDGAYASASWFLTGERRPYDDANGEIGHVAPANDLSPCEHHWGAWELAARTSWLDLSDGAVHGGRMFVFTGGVNWYWNRYVRVMLNTNLAHVTDGPNDGRLAVLQSRFQLVF